MAGDKEAMAASTRFALLIYLVAFSVILLYAFYGVWAALPAQPPAQADVAQYPPVEWTFFGIQTEVSLEMRLLLLVIVAGAFGACVMALQSFADYRGENKLVASWAVFYFVRPIIGAGVAFVIYYVVRGGFLAGTTIDVGSATPYGIVAVSALVGMFSDDAVVKLNEVFSTLFKSDDTREDKLVGPVIETKTLPDATTGTAYEAHLKVSSGTSPYKWTVAPELPAGLALDKNTGKITGTFRGAAQKTTHKFTVTDADGAAATVELELNIQ